MTKRMPEKYRGIKMIVNMPTFCEHLASIQLCKKSKPHGFNKIHKLHEGK